MYEYLTMKIQSGILNRIPCNIDYQRNSKNEKKWKKYGSITPSSSIFNIGCANILAPLKFVKKVVCKIMQIDGELIC